MIIKCIFSHLVSDIELAKEISAAVGYPKLHAQNPLGTSITSIAKLQIQ